MAYAVTSATLDISLNGVKHDIYTVVDDEKNRSYEVWVRADGTYYWIRNRQVNEVVKQGGATHQAIAKAVDDYNHSEPEAPEPEAPEPEAPEPEAPEPEAPEPEAPEPEAPEPEAPEPEAPEPEAPEPEAPEPEAPEPEAPEPEAPEPEEPTDG